MTTRVTPLTPPPAAPARSTLATSWPLLGLVKKVIHPHARTTPGGTAPTVSPFERPAAAIDGIDTYASGARVWAYIGGAWLTATVADISGSCALVAYRMPGSATRLIETVHASQLQRWDRPAEHDLRIDIAAECAPTAREIPDTGQARVILAMDSADQLEPASPASPHPSNPRPRRDSRHRPRS